MASPVDTSVKFFRDDFPGAPALSGLAGALVSVLDACLDTGFGLRPAVSVTVAAGVATLTLASDVKNANLLDSVILVDGVTGALTALNGEQRVTAVSDVLLKFATSAADGTAAGTITVKSAPAGWQKVFSGTNKAVYKSLLPESLGMCLWVNDTGTANANVRGYETMTSLDTGTGAFPTVLDIATGGLWAKSALTTSAACRWDVFADARAFFYCPVVASSQNATYIGQGGYGFGDMLAFKAADSFSATIFATRSVSDLASYGSVFVGGQPNNCGAWPRSYTGLGSAVRMYATPYVGLSAGASGMDTLLGDFPPPTDGGLRLTKMFATEGSQTGPAAVQRAEVPGVRYCPQGKLYAAFQRGDRIVIGGKKMYVVAAGAYFTESAASTSLGRGFFDITGPWW